MGNVANNMKARGKGEGGGGGSEWIHAKYWHNLASILDTYGIKREKI